MNKSDKEKLMKLFAIIGALVAIIQAILGFAGGAWFPIIGPLIALILAIIVCLSVFKPNDPIPYDKMWLLIFGVLLIIFGSWLGGVLLIIGAIFGFLK